MVACGRAIKRLEPGAKVVFIGPCLAKKSEAREPDIADAVDYVLTFQEVRDLFDFADIHPEMMAEDNREHSSTGGRIYARAGGVSQAVQDCVQRLNPGRKIKVHAVQASGVPACKQLLNDLKEGKLDANFLEGMGCAGGCVGGPRALIGKELARDNVNRYGEEAPTPTPVDNPYVIELLHRLGFPTVESLLENDTLCTPHILTCGERQPRGACAQPSSLVDTLRHRAIQVRGGPAWPSPAWPRKPAGLLPVGPSCAHRTYPFRPTQRHQNRPRSPATPIQGRAPLEKRPEASQASLPVPFRKPSHIEIYL